ncbi:MAG: diacylglycerol kinase family lipid kinase [Calditrichota bacterium]
MLKYALILNPNAGRGKGAKLAEEIVALAKAELGDVTVFKTEYVGHAREIASKIKDEFDVLIAAGGDGTVHEIVNGMMFGHAALAAIPIGSGNDFIKMLDLTKDPAEAINVIKNNVRKKIDVGQVNDQYFPNGVGVGFDAWVVIESSKVKRLRGFLIYLYSVLKTVFAYENQNVIMTLNGKTEQKRIFLIAVGNGRAMGGGFFLTPDAEIDDGFFDICIIRALKKREVFTNVPKALHGAHVTMEQVEMLRTDKLHIESPTGIAVHADGELLGVDLKELDFRIHPKILEVIYCCQKNQS